MRYMIHDPGLGYIVKDLGKGEQCQYKSDRNAAVAVRNGIGSTEYETMRREVLVHLPEVELREQVRILREALNGLCDSQLTSKDREDAIARGLATLDATKEGV